MNLSTKQRIATLGIAAATVIALQGTVFGAGNEAPTACDSWHPRGAGAGQYHETLNPQDPLAVIDQHSWNPDSGLGGPNEHRWHPDAAAAHAEHGWHPEGAPAHAEHGWNLAGNDTCVLPSSTTP